MKIGQLTQRTVVTADISETLTAAAVRMRAAEISALAVTQDGRPIGVLSERDLTRALAEGVDPKAATLAEYVSLELNVARPDDDSQQVASRMLELGVRHMPVVEDSKVIGMISMRDLLLLEALAHRAAPTLS